MKCIESPGSKECNICGKILKRPHLKRHIEAVHKQSRNYRCDLCEKTYTDSTPLRVHRPIPVIVFSGQDSPTPN